MRADRDRWIRIAAEYKAQLSAAIRTYSSNKLEGGSTLPKGHVPTATLPAGSSEAGSILPNPHITIATGCKGDPEELCFEWWVNDNKVTLYAKPTTLLRKYGSESIDYPKPHDLIEWLTELENSIKMNDNNPPIAKRRDLPKVGETAKTARKLGRHVADSIPDDAHVVHIDDFYPLRYAWTIYWSNGITDGVRSDETDAILIKEAQKRSSSAVTIPWCDKHLPRRTVNRGGKFSHCPDCYADDRDNALSEIDRLIDVSNGVKEASGKREDDPEGNYCTGYDAFYCPEIVVARVASCLKPAKSTLELPKFRPPPVSGINHATMCSPSQSCGGLYMCDKHKETKEVSSSAAPDFPYNHLAVIGFNELKKYVPTMAGLKRSSIAKFRSPVANCCGGDEKHKDNCTEPRAQNYNSSEEPCSEGCYVSDTCPHPSPWDSNVKK